MRSILMIGAVVISGCATTPTPSVGFLAGYSPPTDDQTRYSISSLRDANDAKDKQTYPDASAVVTSAVESALLRMGKHVVTEDSSDIEITGIVLAFYRGSFNGRYSTVGLELRAMDKKSRVVVWKATYVRGTNWEYDRDPANLAKEVADELVKKVFAPPKKQ
jgi:hypothetical protein